MSLSAAVPQTPPSRTPSIDLQLSKRLTAPLAKIAKKLAKAGWKDESNKTLEILRRSGVTEDEIQS